jgi:hypothetical protein
MIGVVCVFLCSSVGLCIFSFKAIFTRSKLETMLHTFATLHGNLKKKLSSTTNRPVKLNTIFCEKKIS